MKRKYYKGVSLFTGAGGMDVGFKKAGVDVVFANEIDKDAAKTYVLNHSDTKIVVDDIENIIEKFNEFTDVDFVFGGPPCQGFSVAGKMDPNDERSKLVFTFLRAVEIIRPRVFIMENVKALGTLKKWENVRYEIFKRAFDMGYDCTYFILNATEFGVPQKRERVFFIGIRGEVNPFFARHLENYFFDNKSKAPSVRDTMKTLGRAGTEKNPLTSTAKITFASNPIMRKSPYSGMYFNGQGRPINVDEYANTLPASMGGNKTPFFDEEYMYGDAKEDWVVRYFKGLVDGSITPEYKEAPKRLRRLTINEAARIQTFPNEYKFFGSKGSVYQQIGNAVPCKLAQAVAQSVIDYIEKEPSN